MNTILLATFLLIWFVPFASGDCKDMYPNLCNRHRKYCHPPSDSLVAERLRKYCRKTCNYCQTDVDKCTDGGHNCDVNANCTNNAGHFICACKYGYHGTGTSCSDVDECTDGTHNCDLNADCTNKAGTFNCSCKSGYHGTGTSCSDVDECTDGAQNCDVNADCTNNAGTFTCSCKSGYHGPGTSCSDVDECTDGGHNCDVNANCTNNAGNFGCACKSGYYGTGTYCSDVDECTVGGHNCDINADCTNYAGYFRCACSSGYNGTGTSCSALLLVSLTMENVVFNGSPLDTSNANTIADLKDKNSTLFQGLRSAMEPAVEKKFKEAQPEIIAVKITQFSPGSLIVDVSATFNSTYSGDTSSVSNNINHALNGSLSTPGLTSSISAIKALEYNDCILGTHNCGTDATCTVNTTSYTCNCNVGFIGDGLNCTDIDECSTNTHNCDTNAVCANAHGTFTCTCNSGYTRNGRSGNCAAYKSPEVQTPFLFSNLEYKDKLFLKDIFLKKQVSNVEQCMLLCQAHHTTGNPSCLSLNFQYGSSSNLYECHLSSSQAAETADLEESHGFIYYRIM